MKNAVYDGNSSAGIREAPSFKLPVINIGTRQTDVCAPVMLLMLIMMEKGLLVNGL